MKKILFAVLMLVGVGWGAITITDFGNHEVFQEMTNGNGNPDTSRIRDIGITYNVSTPYDSVNYKILRWRDDSLIMSGKLHNAVTANNYTDTIQDVPRNNVLSIVDTAWYRIVIYAGSDSSRGVNKWGVGMLVSPWGHSKMTTRYNSHQKPPTPASDMSGKFVRKYMKWCGPANDDWQDSVSASDSSTSLIPSLVNQIIDSAHCLVGIVGYAEGGTLLSPSAANVPYWKARNNANPQDTSIISGAKYYIYGKYLKTILPFKPLHLINWIGGNDAGNAVWHVDTMKRSFDSVFTWLARDLGYTPKNWIIPENDYRGSPDYQNVAIVSVMEAQKRQDDSTSRFLLPQIYDLEYLDYVHPSHYAQDSIGKRSGLVIARFINSNISGNYRGPRINNANAVTRGQIRINFGLISGRKLAIDSMSRFEFKGTIVDSIQKLSFSMASDSLSVVIDVCDRVMAGDSIRFGYDREKSLSSIIRDTKGQLSERSAYTWIPVTISTDSIAASTDRYCIATATDSNWSNTSIWSTTDGGAGGASVPDTTNDVFFTANTGANKCVMTGNSSCRSIYSVAGYTGQFKDKGYSVICKNGIVYDGKNTTLTGSWTINQGDVHYGSGTSLTTRNSTWDIQDNSTLDFDHLNLTFKKIICAYPNKTINITGSQGTTAGPRLLSVKGGSIIIASNLCINADSNNTVCMDTINGSIIKGIGGLVYKIQGSSSRTIYVPSTTHSGSGSITIQNATTGTGSIGTTELLGPIISGNAISIGFNGGTGPGIFKTNGWSMTAPGVFTIALSNAAPYLSFNFDSSRISCSKLSTLGTLTLDTIYWKNAKIRIGGNLNLHNGSLVSIIDSTNGKIVFTSGVDSITTNGKKVPEIVLNNSGGSLRIMDSLNTIQLIDSTGKFNQNSKTIYVDSNYTNVSTDSAKMSADIIIGKNYYRGANTLVTRTAGSIILDTTFARQHDFTANSNQIGPVIARNVTFKDSAKIQKLTISDSGTVTYPSTVGVRIDTLARTGGSSGKLVRWLGSVAGSAARVWTDAYTAVYSYFKDITASDTITADDGTSVDGGGNTNIVFGVDTIPTIDSITPEQVGPGDTVTLAGTGFGDSVTVQVRNNTMSLLSSGETSAVWIATAMPEGPHQVIITNMQYGTKDTTTLHYDTIPALLSCVPDTGNFRETKNVTLNVIAPGGQVIDSVWEDDSLCTIVSRTDSTVVVTIPAHVEVSDVDVRSISKDGYRDTLPNGFTHVNMDTIPAMVSALPLYSKLAGGGHGTIAGTGMTEVDSVWYGDSLAVIDSATYTTLYTTIPAYGVRGGLPIRTHAVYGYRDTLLAGITYKNIHITSITPIRGVAGDTLDFHFLWGAGTSGLAVMMGDSAATVVAGYADTLARVVAPVHANGSVQVRAINGAGDTTFSAWIYGTANKRRSGFGLGLGTGWLFGF